MYSTAVACVPAWRETNGLDIGGTWATAAQMCENVSERDVMPSDTASLIPCPTCTKTRHNG